LRCPFDLAGISIARGTVFAQAVPDPARPLSRAVAEHLALILAAIQKASEVDLGDFIFDFRQGTERASTYIDLSVLSAKRGLAY
jgi:hypothetical protein